MHTIEPYYRWKEYYDSVEDPYSPFFKQAYSEFSFTSAIYDHFIHPQWDNMGSPTLFLKILFADYDESIATIELIGEWNDCLHNDIMTFKRDVVEHMMLQGIKKFILIGENVLNFHPSDDCYYEEWFEEVEDEDGWIVLLNFREHVLKEFQNANVDSYFVLGGKLNDISWRTLNPRHFCQVISGMVQKRLGQIF